MKMVYWEGKGRRSIERGKIIRKEEEDLNEKEAVRISLIRAKEWFSIVFDYEYWNFFFTENNHYIIKFSKSFFNSIKPSL